MTIHGAPSIRGERKLPVLIVDDHALVRQEIRSMLEGHADLQIVGEAGDGFEAIDLVRELRPSIVLMDINMPRMNGIEATAKIRSEYPDIIIIGLSVNANGAYQELMTRAGAVRLIFKNEAPERLYDAIQESVKVRGMSERLSIHQ